MNVKRIFNLGMVLVMAVTSFALSQPVAAEAPAKFTPRITPGAQVAPGEVVVAFANSDEKNLIEKIEQAVETANETGGEVTRLSIGGEAVIRVNGDTTAALAELNSQPGVLYAEPNYVYSLPTIQNSSDPVAGASDYVLRRVTPNNYTEGKSIMAVSNSTIQGMVAMGVYPSDTYITNNQGWYSMGADIVWPNATASAGICEIDTGVDSAHPDLSGRIISGYDFVNADVLPADDNGHGTHVAGILVANKNNAKGISGVSTGKVVAVKALDAQGVGTNFDVAMAIQYCANRTDIRVINLSLGGPDSSLIKEALRLATTPTNQSVSGGTFNGQKGKGKLVVAAAGNITSNDPLEWQTEVYPAGYADDVDFTQRILSVGATGFPDGENILYECRMEKSKFGTWVNVSAPGYRIYSTTPYDKPFYQNGFSDINTRYDYMSGTSMAAAFVSASAARRMGYKSSETSQAVFQAIIDTGDALDPDCTENEMLQAKRVNVATLLDRTALTVSVFDSATGMPLNGATVSVTFTDAGTASSRKSVIAPIQVKEAPGVDLDPNRIFTYYFADVDILDIPTKDKNGNAILQYKINVSKTNYTIGAQQIFRESGLVSIPTPTPGAFNVYLNGSVPPRSAGFDIVLGWNKWRQDGYEEALNANDLDLYVWLPPAGADTTQPAPFIVGYGGDSFGYLENDPYGTLNAFPFARMKREGGYSDGKPLETTTILNRDAYGTTLGSLAPAKPGVINKLAPWYGGVYTALATDYGQVIDHDNDGCGDNYGPNYDSNYAPGGECAGKTAGIPLLGAYFTPYAYVWKDGVVQFFADASNAGGPWPAGTECNTHWWKAFEINSPAQGLTTAPTFDTTFAPNPTRCDDGSTPDFIPYVGTFGSGGRITLSGLGK